MEYLLVLLAGLVAGYLIGWNRRRIIADRLLAEDDTAQHLAQQYGIPASSAQTILRQQRKLAAMRAEREQVNRP